MSEFEHTVEEIEIDAREIALIQVAGMFAGYSPKEIADNDDPKALVLVEKSREYLNYLLDDALEDLKPKENNDE